MCLDDKLTKGRFALVDLIFNLTGLRNSWGSDYILRTLFSSVPSPVNEFIADQPVRRWGLKLEEVRQG